MYDPEKLLQELDKVLTDNEGNPLVPSRIADKMSDIQDWLDARSLKLKLQNNKPQNNKPQNKENYDGKGLT